MPPEVVNDEMNTAKYLHYKKYGSYLYAGVGGDIQQLYLRGGAYPIVEDEQVPKGHSRLQDFAAQFEPTGITVSDLPANPDGVESCFWECFPELVFDCDWTEKPLVLVDVQPTQLSFVDHRNTVIHLAKRSLWVDPEYGMDPDYLLVDDISEFIVGCIKHDDELFTRTKLVIRGYFGCECGCDALEHSAISPQRITTERELFSEISEKVIDTLITDGVINYDEDEESIYERAILKAFEKGRLRAPRRVCFEAAVSL
jgi:hypothetical protein